MEQNIRRLFAAQNPYDAGKNRMYFLNAIKETCKDFEKNSDQYRRICGMYQFDTGQLDSIEELYRIPPLPTSFLKRNDSSVPHPSFAKVTSSGTSGRVSQVGYSFGELLLLARMAIRLGRVHRLFSIRPTHYLMLGYQPVRENKTVISKTAYLSSLYAFPVSRRYALNYRDGEYHLDLEALVHRIRVLAKQRHPVRIIGFPFYLLFLLHILQKQGFSLRLPKGSKILLGGGWKQFSGEEVPKEKLHSMAGHILGIPPENIHEFFGAAEHPVLYCTCKNHHFHVPAYAEVLIRDVQTLKPLEKGKTGLLNLMTPVHSSLPIMSILTDDLGILHSGEECGCGIAADYLEILGRVNAQDVKTCSAGAREYLRGEAL